jgi:hypothetical protein
MIASGEKTIETRTWSTPYRGELLICSSKNPEWPGRPGGQALAIAELYDCRRMTKADEIQACCKIYSSAYSWFLRNIRPIKPFPVRGNLGIYEVEMPDG